VTEPPRPFATSLCHRCVHHRVVQGGRSAFLMCQEPSLPKYGPQPVVRCGRFAPSPPAADSA
jgi:hypothetical protein